MRQLWRDVLAMKTYRGWRRSLGWAAHTVWNDVRWGW